MMFLLSLNALLRNSFLYLLKLSNLTGEENIECLNLFCRHMEFSLFIHVHIHMSKTVGPNGSIVT
uniref:Uncharacterized protein n=1 Tax=Cannabis sativa TaxID=3483 RepID=A0A803R3R2_CANSA